MSRGCPLSILLFCHIIDFFGLSFNHIIINHKLPQGLMVFCFGLELVFIFVCICKSNADKSTQLFHFLNENGKLREAIMNFYNP